jgi:pilus assembly protein CpaE
MRDVQRLVIVDPMDATREPLRNQLLGVESVWLEAECSRYEFFFDVVAQSNPDVAVIALDADPNKALQLISELSAERPELGILAVSAKGDGQLILQALRGGAHEFLTAPVVLEELLQAMQRFQHKHGPRENGTTNGTPKVNSMVVAVLGSRGGVGATSLAVNLGCSMAAEKQRSVSLLDLDLALGDADVALDLMPVYTLADVAMNIVRLDMTFLKRSLVQHAASGLALLPHPVQLQDVEMIKEEHLQRVVGLLRASESHQVLDLSKGFTALDMAALRMADVILLVAQLELSSLRNVVRITARLGSEDGLTQKTHIVMNRVGCDFFDGAIGLKKAEETIGTPVFWQIPNEPKSMMSSRNAGIPLILHAPRSKTHQSIHGLAQMLLGTSNEVDAKKKKSGFFSFA